MRPDFGEQLTGSGRSIRDPRVLAAMAAIPREEFVPEDLRHYAYEDGPVGIGDGQTISQPYIVALMTESLGLGVGEKVLEVGTGSGYQAAVLAEIGCEVYSVERIETLSRRASEVLADLGYCGVHLRVDDGAVGWPDHAPYDAVIVTCAAESFPDSLFEQLRDGGRMVIPIGGRDDIQELWLYEKISGEKPRRRKLTDVRFVPFV
ncbi:MAG: protein-L-isoaspartate(D-aspartate) O-methyltransferase [Luteolibacter sp.]